MAWYFYSGNVVKSVPVSRTKSVAVRPNSKVEILELTLEAQILLSKGVLRRTGKPLGATSMESQPPRPRVSLRDILPPSGLALHFAEKGVTTSEAMPPHKPVGSPEYTIHEREVAGSVVVPVDAGDVAVLPVEEAAEEQESGKSKRRRGH